MSKISILAGNLNSDLSCLITAVSIKWCEEKKNIENVHSKLNKTANISESVPGWTSQPQVNDQTSCH